MRVVLDTNVLLSGLAYPHSPPGRIVAAWRSGALDVVLSPYLLSELARVLPRLDHRLHLSDAERADLVDSLAILADFADPPPLALEPLLRDAADAPVLALLAWPDARAECLVAGDNDLLSLANRWPIMTPTEFCQRFGV